MSDAPATVWTYPRILTADIIAEVSHVFNIPEDIIKGPRRSNPFVRPRFAYCYLARRLTDLSYPQIGRVLNGRDHSTIIHGEREAEYHMQRDPEYRAYVDAVRIRLLTTHAREKQRRAEALAVNRERLRLEMLAAERRAREEANRAANNAELTPITEMDELSHAVAAYVAAGGSFVEVHA